MLQTYFNLTSYKAVSCGIDIVQKMIPLYNCHISYISILYYEWFYYERIIAIYFDDIFMRIKIYSLSIHIFACKNFQTRGMTFNNTKST